MILFELNARLHNKSFDELADEHLPRLAALGFDWIWLMGIWRMGPAGVVLSRKYAPDFEGSPYAIAAYEVEPLLGGEAALRAFVARAHAAGIKVMVDFVPNHLAFDTPLIDQDPGMVIHSNPSIRREVKTDYYDHPRGRLAHGKDPYFEGWNDTADAASGVVDHLMKVWNARVVGAIDPEDFYDFQVNRPIVGTDEHG